MRSLLSRPVDWLGALHRAAVHDVVGIVGDGLKRSAADLVPDAIRRVLELHAAERARAADRAWSELTAILAALREADIPVVPFKGPVLAHELYGDPALRSCRDLDFLVRDADADEVVRILRARGYDDPALLHLSRGQFRAARRLFGEWSLYHPDRLTVEPHSRLAPSTLAIDADPEAMMRRATPRMVGRVEMTALAPEDRFLMLAIHGGKEVWSHLKSLADVDRFLAVDRGTDWDAVARRARRAGVQRMIVVALDLARRAFGTEPPGPWESIVASDHEGTRLASRLHRRLELRELDEPPMKSISALRFRMRERARDRLSYAARTLLTPRPEHYRVLRLPDSLIALYVPLKVVHDYVLLPLWRTVRH